MIVCLLFSDIIRAVQESHSKYEERKKKEKLERQKELENKKLTEAKKKKEMLEKAEKRASYLDKKVKKLNADEKKIDNEFDLAQRLLSSAKEDLDKAINNEDMVGIKVAREIVESASKKLQAISTHKVSNKHFVLKSEQNESAPVGGSSMCIFVEKFFGLLIFLAV